MIVTVRDRTFEISPARVAGSELLKALVSGVWQNPTLDRDPDEVALVLRYLDGERVRISYSTLDYYGIIIPDTYIWNQDLGNVTVPIPADAYVPKRVYMVDSYGGKFHVRLPYGVSKSGMEVKCIGGKLVSVNFHDSFSHKIFDEQVSDVIDMPVIVTVQGDEYLECVVDNPNAKLSVRLRSAERGRFRYKYAVAYTNCDLMTLANEAIADIYFKGRPGIVTIMSGDKKVIEISDSAITEEFESVDDVYHLSWFNRCLMFPTGMDNRLSTRFVCEKIIVVMIMD